MIRKAFSSRLHLRIVVAFCFLIISCGSLLAQPGGGPPPDPGKPVPFQGFIYLVVAGALLGFKKIMDSKKGC
jgi:hypothetical protein